jgi:SPP1 gp7 family putative phage head morphogenesis protein
MPILFDENIKLSHRLQGIINVLGGEIAEILEKAIERVTGRALLLESKAEETESLIRRRKFLEKQKAEIEKVLNEVYQDVGQIIKNKAVETAQASPVIADTILKKVIPDSFKIHLGVPKLNKKQMIAWFESAQIEGLFFNDWLKKLEGNAAARIIRGSRIALVSGEGKKTAAKRIQEALNIGRKSAEGLAHNAIFQASRWAERQYHLENAERLRGLRYVAELDRRTTPICRSLDGKVFPVKDAPQPPLHWLCRSHVEPVFKSVKLEKYLSEQTRIARIDTEGRTVKHRDGTTSTKYEKLRVKFPERRLNYNRWLTSMVKSNNPADVSFAREVLRPSRFKLVKTGKLKMNQLYYAGKLRNLKELKRLMK